MTKKLIELLPLCSSETDVQRHYLDVIESYFPGCSPFRTIPRSGIQTDGVMEHKKLGLKILAEFKYKKDISKREIFAGCVVQILFYLKRLEWVGEKFPNVLFIANENNCYCFHSDPVLEYLDESIDWHIKPSSSASINPELCRKLEINKDINPFLFTIGNVNFRQVIDEIVSLNYGTKRKVMLNGVNISRYFTEFTNQVIVRSSQFDANELVNIFMNTINDPKQKYTYPHPDYENVLVTRNFNQIRINKKKFDSFFSHVRFVESPKSQRELDAICDRLIEDLTRRRKGEFYTPTEWVFIGHSTIEEVLGIDWKEKYVVWYVGSGTQNISRDYHFDELYCSTINQSDIDIAEARGYNPEAIKFQYDFLNDDVQSEGIIGIDRDKLDKLAPGLVKAFEEGRPIVIIMNPPYRTVSGVGFGEEGSLETRVHGLMEGFEQARSQLYTQFLYRVLLLAKKYKHKDISIGVYHPIILMTGSSYGKFRKVFLDSFRFEKGIMFNAGHFSSVDSNWAVAFTVFTPGPSNKRFDFDYSILDIIDSEMVEIGNKLIYNRDCDRVLNIEWMVRETSKKPKVDFPILSNPVNVRQSGEGKMCEGSLGFFLGGNSARYNNNLVMILTAAFTAGGIPIIEENYYKLMASFSARKTIKTNWINDKDEYIIPNTEHEDYEQWNKDCIIYSLFNNSSNQSSLRRIRYKRKFWNIENQFFWMSNKIMQDLSNKYGFGELYNDSIVFNQDRFVYKLLQEVDLSGDAKEVLDKAVELTIKSFSHREQLHEIHPEWHLDAWDGGWYQIKFVLKEFFKSDLEDFNQLYRSFEDRIREGVYKFGFLK